MHIIKNMCSLYSSKDWIQPVAGLYSRKLPPHSQRTNLKAWINNHGLDHSKLHDPIIASWLLHIPEKLSNERTTGFDLFSWGTDGGINFYTHKAPEYTKLKDLDLSLAITG